MSKQYPLDVYAWMHDDGKTLVSKGHHDAGQFKDACRVYWGTDLDGFGEVKQGWFRTIPDRTGEYQWIAHPAEPNSRGAYPATYISDNGY